jgi:dihydrofolate reductase
VVTSLDGYTEDEHGHFGWGAPEDEEVHSYINELASSVGTYLYGRRMYETMVYWETADAIADQLQGVRLDLALMEERRFRNGVIVLRYAVRRD